MGAARHPLGLAAWLLPAVVGLPVAAGLVASLLQAFGVTPGLSDATPSLDAWRRLADAPGLWTSVLLTLRTGWLASCLSAASALLIGLGGPAWARRGAGSLLAVPHAALAIGLSFLVAPTGWLVRLAGLPPLGFATVGDGFGVSIILALWVKETPFLLLCLLATLGQADVARSRMAAGGLGYAPLRASLLVVLPRVWPQLRLPVLAVLAFSLSVADVALVLGPQTPPTLAVLILRWSADPDFSRWQESAAASILLVAIVLASFAGLHAIEVTAAMGGRWLARRGGRGAAQPAVAGTLVAAVIGILGLGALATLLLWAGASAWRYPAMLPDSWSAAAIAARLHGLTEPAVTTLWLGAASTAAALALAVATLQAGAVSRLIWLPLLLPQAGFLFGMQMLLVVVALDGSAAALVWSHLLFVLPYVLLTLQGPWQALDRRYARAAAGLGASPARVLLRVTLPLLARPLATAVAVGFAVSVALFLPTVFAGAGRVATLATEAVSLSSGGDRRLLATTALAQAALPAFAFAAVLRRR